jgi:ABC-type antimicrobial peptide transport system permease subunit
VPRNPFVVVVKASGDTSLLAAPIKDAVKRLDAALPIYDVRPLDAYLEEARAVRAFTAMLAGVFAFAAVLLASVGVYGVIAYSVSMRRREFGVRLALGARTGQIMGRVFREASGLTLAGVSTGLIAAVSGAWWLRSQLYDVAPWDPISLVVTTVVLGSVAALACLVPARRATQVEPADVLRAD